MLLLVPLLSQLNPIYIQTAGSFESVRACCKLSFNNLYFFCSERLLTPSGQSPVQKETPPATIHVCIWNIFAATLDLRREPHDAQTLIGRDGGCYCALIVTASDGGCYCALTEDYETCDVTVWVLLSAQWPAVYNFGYVTFLLMLNLRNLKLRDWGGSR
jgi:hypothetical protein